MYYLNCLKNCVDLELSHRLTDYKNHFLLNEEEKRDIVVLAHRYRPRVMRNIIFFEVDDQSYMLPHTSNNFLEFNDPVVIASFNMPSNVVVVDGVSSIIRRVMIYKYTWMHDYFEVPYEREKWRIGLAAEPRGPRRRYFVSYPRHSAMDGVDIPLWCGTGIILCFIFPPVGIALIAVGACRTGCEVIRCAEDDRVRETYIVY